ncbi:cytochrome P450 [Hypoxylon sp. FL1150]|nr:cytochrome P450 [Hypoxylon sp. FL1150]
MDYLSSFSLYGSGLPQNHASQAALPSAILGIIFHLTIASRIQMEYFVKPLLAVASLAALTIAFVYLSIGTSILGTTARICIIGGFFNAGLFSSMVIYRLFFHRLRKFPGPLGSKVSRVFDALRAAKHVRYNKELVQLHAEYGDFIRTGPRELCIVRASAVPTIYGPGTKCRKGTWYAQSCTNHDKSSVQMSVDFEKHKLRRRAWDKAFSVKALHTYEPRIKVLVDQLVTQISKRGVLDVSAWSNYLTYDVMGEIGFSKDFGCVSNGAEHAATKAIHDHLIALSIGAHIPWLLNLASYIPGITAGYADFFNYCEVQVNAKLKTLDLSKHPQDIMTWLLKPVVEKDASASPTKESLSDDARLLIIAGSDTTASTLAQTLFFLAKHPAIFQKLQGLVDAAMPSPSDWTYEKTRSITYIDNIIDESLRLKPAVTSGFYRETPPQGIQVDEQHIPGNTVVFVPTQMIQTDPRYWQEAAEFVPERFGERRAEMGTDKSPYMPFGLGAFGCSGKNMAIATLRITLCRVAQEFDISFASEEKDIEKFDKEPIDTISTCLQPLNLRFTPRKR